MNTLAISMIRTRDAARSGRLWAILLVCVSCISRAHAGATILLEEPYGYDGAFAGTGHSAVYLNHVCSASPVLLRPCREGESGVVVSRYDGITDHDWIAIPLVPYLYAVDRTESVPLFADAKMVGFLRDQYRRDHLEAVAPDLPDGGKPGGNWYELVGASYERTIYGFEIETTPEQDARLIAKLNSQPNRERYNFIRRNCADFVREVIDFYYPHAVHRSIVGDLGVTTPKQIAKMLSKYMRHHPDLESSVFLVPQVPGAIRRSTPVHGVLESVVAAKKYMIPVVVLHPYIAGGLLAGYFGQRFDPSKNALIFDSRRELEAAMTRGQRTNFQSRMDEMIQTRVAADSSHPEKAAVEKTNAGKNNDAKNWQRWQAAAEPSLDGSGHPVLQMDEGDELAQVGLSRSNILSISDTELAAGLLEARLRQQLKSGNYRKTSSHDVEKDLLLLEQLLLPQQPREAVAKPYRLVKRPPAAASLQ